ncbi:hypothetical protein [Roseomonas indoligenes]|uniref:O-antigen ligase domain-containing protein n=1 Tax=Roseomonas indoligenes TaxID=2820811 RepID=A0A940MWT1_9PROT|nr:hypothetical protein [Pararoseomonas indoligenes]MBP0492632.1 hypothetical protein [Pararoseomonas indoligenes]
MRSPLAQSAGLGELPARPAAGAGRAGPPWPWFLLLPMFFQIFYYKAETSLLYPLSKGWAVLMAPLLLYGATALRLPDGPLYLLLCAYSLAVTPFLSMIYLPNSLVDALLSTIRAWPLTFYFSFAATLLLLRPSEEALKRGALAFGLATFGSMVLLWFTVPEAWYQPGAFGANLFSWDDGRGNYIRMPMMLGELALFWMWRRFLLEWRPWQFLVSVAAVVALATMYKARLPIGVSVLIMTATLVLRLPSRWLWGLGALAMLPVAGAAMVYGPGLPELLGHIFDESLFIRLRSSVIAWDWITSDPLKLLFGSGSTSSYSEITMADFFGYADFWLTDIGWLGVLMEYGAIGFAMIAAIHARALITARAARNGTAFRSALMDYVAFELLCSVVYSVMYAPGPVVTVAVIAWWLRMRDAAGMAADQPGWPDTATPVPQGGRIGLEQPAG